jgi:hypothetical protein
LERAASFVQVVDGKTDLGNTLCQPYALDFDNKPAGPEQVFIRRERQTFRRLPKTGAIVFAVKTSIRCITELDVNEIRSLKEEASRWPEAVANYKGRHCWGDCVFRYCDEIISKTCPDTI